MTVPNQHADNTAWANDGTVPTDADRYRDPVDDRPIENRTLPADPSSDPAFDDGTKAPHHAASPASAPTPTSPAPAAPAPAEHVGAEGSSEDLFAAHDVDDLRSRWNAVQAAFVDDPRDCVQQADGLVGDVVQQLTSSFSQARSRLEEQWARGEEASTEDLRVALKRYREFFDRLLSV